VLERVASIAAGCGLEPLDVTASPLRGPAGNREFFLLAGVGERVAAAGEAGAGPGAIGPLLAQRIATVTA
jgi:hypothetical protein